MATVLVKRFEGTLPWRVDVAAVEEPHWTGWTGGWGRFLDQEALAGYVWCDTIPDGLQRDAGHTCSHEPPPHRIKVLIVKRKRDADAYRQLARCAVVG